LVGKNERGYRGAKESKREGKMTGQNELPVSVTVGLVDRLSAKMDKIKNKFPELGKNVARMKGNFDALQESTKGFRSSVEKFSEAVGPSLSKVGKAMTVGITLPVVAGAAYSIKKFMDFESALNEVQGATDLSGASLKDFGDKMLKLSTKTTFSQEKLLGMASAAGEAGVRGSENLEKFALTLSQLEKTANLAGPDTAQALYRILTLTKEGVGSVGQFGSALTALENKYGVKASKILESTEMMTREIGRFGLSSTQIAGLATSIAPLGFEAKNASTAVGEAFRGIDTAIREGGIKMQGLQKITGMTGDELKKQFQDNPEKVFEAFLNGLNTIEKKGGKTSEALAFFGASGDKTGIILTGLAKDIDNLRTTQAFAGEEFGKNTALTEEYNDTTTTLAASLAKFKNNTDALSISLGNRLAPFVAMAANAMTNLMQWFNEHPKVATFVAAIAGFLAVLGPIIMGLAGLINALGTIMKALNVVSAAWTFLTAVSWAALLPYIAIGAAIVGLIAVIWIFRDAIMKGIVAAWDWVIEKIQMVLGLMKKAADFLANNPFTKFTGIGLAARGAGKLLDLVSPAGKDTGAAPAQAASANSDFITQTNNARVDINVNAPQSTRVIGESQGGFLNINRGMAGAF
jgi:TP901 family phage tail tape measure protein